MPDDDRIDFAALARQARLMQGEVAGAQESLARLQGSGFGGKGMVQATVSGEGRVVDLRIDPSVIDPDAPEALAAMVVEAVDNAQAAVREQRAEQVSGVADSMGGLLAALRGNGTGGGTGGRAEPRTRMQDGPRPRPRG